MRHVFVDESKARDYLLVAVVFSSEALPMARRQIRSLILPGQSRIHMRKEGDSRRRRILDGVCALAPTALIVSTAHAGQTERLARAACLRTMVARLASPEPTRLCLERDESLLRHDRQCLIESSRAAGMTDLLEYRHEAAATEPLLAVPDAIAWAWARGGEWRRRCRSVVSDRIEV